MYYTTLQGHIFTGYWLTKHQHTENSNIPEYENVQLQVLILLITIVLLY